MEKDIFDKIILILEGMERVQETHSKSLKELGNFLELQIRLNKSFNERLENLENKETE